MNPEILRRLRERAAGCCEYCWLPTGGHALPFQVDHIIAKQHGGADNLDNFAYACVHCNCYKGPNVAGIDPDTNMVVRLYHPRLDRWTDHFRWSGPLILPVSAIGRATVRTLNMNDPESVMLRESLEQERNRR